MTAWIIKPFAFVMSWQLQGHVINFQTIIVSILLMQYLLSRMISPCKLIYGGSFAFYLQPWIPLLFASKMKVTEKSEAWLIYKLSSSIGKWYNFESYCCLFVWFHTLLSLTIFVGRWHFRHSPWHHFLGKTKDRLSKGSLVDIANWLLVNSRVKIFTGVNFVHGKCSGSLIGF